MNNTCMNKIIHLKKENSNKYYLCDKVYYSSTFKSSLYIHNRFHKVYCLLSQMIMRIFSMDLI